MTYFDCREPTLRGKPVVYELTWTSSKEVAIKFLRILQAG